MSGAFARGGRKALIHAWPVIDIEMCKVHCAIPVAGVLRHFLSHFEADFSTWS